MEEFKKRKMEELKEPITPAMMQQVGYNEFRLSKEGDPKEWNEPCKGITKGEYFALEILKTLMQTVYKDETLDHLERHWKYICEKSIEFAEGFSDSTEYFTSE